MTAHSETAGTGGGYDFELGLPGFNYSDLFDPARLKELADKFYAEVQEKEPVLGEALRNYIDSHGFGVERRVESKILTDAAPFLSDFVARMFRITHERADMEKAILEQNPIW